MTREAALNALLGSLFNAEELRIHLAQEREGGELVKALPGVTASLAVLVSAVVEALAHRGFIDRDFFDNLEAARPRRIGEIRAVRAQWLRQPKLDRGELWADGRYELHSRCGEGGYGLVWKAVDTRTHVFVALKILLEQHADDRRVRQRFFRGAAVLAELSHPAIVRVHSGVEQEGLRFFYVMDFIDGSSLDALVGKRPIPELLEYVLQIGDALGHLHTRDLLHRDIKPSNILVTTRGQARLIDFDLVTGDAYAPMTTRGLGTAIYAPPEASASDKKTAAYDVFSLARTVEYVSRGRDPEVAEVTASDPVATLDTSDAVRNVLRAALQVEPSKRTQSVNQFCADLRCAQATAVVLENPEIALTRSLAVLVPVAQANAVGAFPRPPTPSTDELDANSSMGAPGSTTAVVESKRASPPSAWAAETLGSAAPQSLPVAEMLGPPAPQPPVVTITSMSATTPAPIVQALLSSPDAATKISPVAPEAPAAAERSRLTAPPVRQDIIETPQRPSEPSTIAPTTEPPRRRWPLVMLAGLIMLATGFTVWSLLAPVVPQPVEPTSDVTPAPVEEGLSKEELERARAAIRNLGLRESDTARAALQRIVDDPNRSARAVAEARLVQAELLLMRTLSCQIAIRIEPTALDGQLQVRAATDPQAAEDLLKDIGEAVDPGQLQRLRALQALVQGKSYVDSLPEGDEIQALVMSAPLWRGTVRSPSAGLITVLGRVPNSSSLCQSVLALALWNSGDRESAKDLLRKITERVTDHLVAGVLLASMSSEEPVSEPNPSAPPEQPPEPVIVANSPKSPPRKTQKPLHPAPALEAPLPIGAVMDIITEQYPAMLKRCKSAPSEGLGEHARADSVRLTIRIRDDGKGLKAVPDDDSEEIPEAKCLASAIEAMKFGPLPETRATFPMKFSL